MPQSLARLAGILCSDPKFQEHIGATSADTAAAILRRECAISSRRELDRDRDAAERFHAIRKQFAYGGQDGD